MLSKFLVGAFFLVLVVSFADAEEKNQTGSVDERRNQCTLLADIFVAAHQYISADSTFERYKKELEIETAGQDYPEEFFLAIWFGGQIAERYVELELSDSDLKLDFLHPCITTEKTVANILTEWWNEKMPSERAIVPDAQKQTPGFSFRDDGTLRPQDYRSLLGEDSEGLAAFSTYTRRGGGQVTGCGIEFSHMDFDEIYSLGASVKLSGSINLIQHPVSLIAGMLKIKGEDVVIFQNGDGSAGMRASAFSMENIYLTYDGTPLLENTEIIECEDPEYVCQVNFNFDTFAQALLEQVAGIAYQREGGSTDVLIDLKSDHLEGAIEENLKFNECALTLVRTAQN